MNLPQAIARVVAKQDLSQEEMTEVMTLIMTGEATPAQIGGFLIGLRMKGESVAEISAAAAVMRQLATRVEVNVDHLVDTCGTGGDASGSFNISTASALVCAAAGAHVAKHGNRSVSSKSGSADVLETAGVNLDLTPEQVGQCIEQVGVGFLFAQKHHSAMRHAIGPRKEMATRTIFNVLGPLTNPAGAPNQVMGVFSADLVKPIAEVLGKLGSRHVMVVHADDGMDEISISAPTQVAEYREGTVKCYEIKAEDFGLQAAPQEAIRVDSAEASLDLIKQVFGGTTGAARDIVVLNAGAALYVSGIAETHQQGVALAQQAIDSGKATQALQGLVDLSRGLAG